MYRAYLSHFQALSSNKYCKNLNFTTMKFYIACIQKLNEIVNETTMSSDDSFVMCPSLRVYEANDFEFLSGESLNVQQFLRSEDISMQFNSLSRIQNLWDIDPNANLFERFEKMVAKIKSRTKDSDLTDLSGDMAILYEPSGKPTSRLKAYTTHLEKYDELTNTYLEIIDQINDSLTDDAKSALKLKSDALLRQIELHVSLWISAGFKNVIEKALGNVNKLSEYDRFISYWDEAKGEMENSKRTGIQSLMSYAQMQIIPYNFYKEEYSWNSLEIDANDLDPLFERAKKPLSGVYDNILEFDYKEDFISKITLNYTIVNIKRPWLKSDLLSSDFIKGIADREKYIYVRKVVLIKDLRVILKENITSEERNILQGNSFIKFGPIFMKNQAFINATTKETFIKPITSKFLYSDKIIKSIDKKLLQEIKTTVNVPQADVPIAKPASPVFNMSARAKLLKYKLAQAKVGQPVEAKPKPQVATPAMAVLPIQYMVFPIAILSDKAQSNIHFIIKDQYNEQVGIYKAEISIKDLNSSFFKEVETNEEGEITMGLPKGTYEIKIRKNNYKEMVFTQAITENANVNIAKKLEPKAVTYNSFFLIGVVAGQIEI